MYCLCVYCLCTVCVLSLYCFCTVYVLPVYCLCPVCVLSVYCLCTVFVLSVYCLCTVCVLSVYYLCTVCVLSLYCLCTVCVLSVYSEMDGLLFFLLYKYFVVPRWLPESPRWLQVKGRHTEITSDFISKASRMNGLNVTEMVDWCAIRLQELRQPQTGAGSSESDQSFVRMLKTPVLLLRLAGMCFMW